MNAEITTAVRIVQGGGVVAFPTETVYGLGADATNDAACEQIFTLKKRPLINPLIIHVADIEQAKSYAKFNEFAEKLSSLWPGPLTMVLPIQDNINIAKNVLAGLDTIAIRIPAHETALELIRQVGSPIAAPSANLSGYVSASKEEHVKADFGKQVFVVPDIENNNCGLESTIIDLSTKYPTILRYGFILPSVIEQILNTEVQISDSLMQIKAPGMMDKHYSPKTSIRLNASYLMKGEIGLNFGSSNLDSSFNLSISGNLIEAAQNLYSALRDLDKLAIENGIRTIAITPIPQKEIGGAINDRLQRAVVK